MTQTDTQHGGEVPSTPGDDPVVGMAERLRAAMAAIGIDIGRPASPGLGQGGVVAFDFGQIALEDAVALTDLAEAEAAEHVVVGPVVESCCGLWAET